MGIVKTQGSNWEYKKDYLVLILFTSKLKKNNHLFDHISVTYNSLKMQHPCAAAIICGDKNDLDEKRIVALDPNFHQIVTQNTWKNKICLLSLQIFKAFLMYQKLSLLFQWISQERGCLVITMVFFVFLSQIPHGVKATVKKGQS